MLSRLQGTGQNRFGTSTPLRFVVVSTRAPVVLRVSESVLPMVVRITLRSTLMLLGL